MLSEHASLSPAAQLSGPSTAAGVDVFVGGLPTDISADTVQEAMSSAGAVLSVRLQLDKATGKCKGYAFVSFTTPAAAKAACSITEVRCKQWVSSVHSRILVLVHSGLLGHVKRNKGVFLQWFWKVVNRVRQFGHFCTKQGFGTSAGFLSTIPLSESDSLGTQSILIFKIFWDKETSNGFRLKLSAAWTCQTRHC